MTLINQNQINLQDNIIPSKYQATCYYATKKKVDNPLTYIVKADYFGTAEKTIKNDFVYSITYKCVSEDKNTYPTIFILGGATLIVCIIFFGRKKNVVRVGKARRARLYYLRDRIGKAAKTNENDDKQVWFDKIKELSGNLGYAKEVKEFKENPNMYKAHVGDVSTVLRVALTGRTNTPDMYEIMQVLGKESIIKRFNKAKENL